MAKSKNHTAHNQTAKDARHGVNRPKQHKYRSTLGMHQKYVKNLKWVRAGNQAARKVAVKAAAVAK